MYICISQLKTKFMKIKHTLLSLVKRIDKGNTNKNLYITKKVGEIIDSISLKEIDILDDNKFCDGVFPILDMLPNGGYNVQNESTLWNVSIWNKENNIIKHTFFGCMCDYMVTYDIQFDMVNRSIKYGFRHLNEKVDKLLDKEVQSYGYQDFHEFIKEFFLISIKSIIFIELSNDKVKLVDIKPKEKHGNFLKGTEIKNQTDITITKVDSLWNVTSMGIGEFKVRGHFRLQCCGVGFSERKLIYIDEFVKTHYIRRSTRDILFGTTNQQLVHSF